MPVGVIRSSAITMPMKPIASPRRRPVKISPAALGSTIFITLAPRALERAAHLQQRRVGVANALVGVHHDHRRGQHDHREHLGGEPDAVHVGDQRDDRRHRRRLQDDEDRQRQPFHRARQPHADAEGDADRAAQRDADEQRLERDEIGLAQASVSQHFNGAAEVWLAGGNAGSPASGRRAPTVRRKSEGGQLPGALARDALQSLTSAWTAPLSAARGASSPRSSGSFLIAPESA